jgi:hypothetical protein
MTPVAPVTARACWIQELDPITAPICIIWGDEDHAAPAEVLAPYRDVPSYMPNIEVYSVPGVLHGYMMPGNKIFHPDTRMFSMARALAILHGLSSEGRGGSG